MKRFLTTQYYSLTIIIFTYLFYRYPFSLGGSLVLCLYIGALLLATLHLRGLSDVAGMLSLILSGIVVINFVSYRENVNATALLYIVIFGLCMYFVVALFYRVAFWPFKMGEPLNASEKKQFRQVQIIIMAPTFFVGLMFYVFSSLMVLAISRSDRDIYNSIPYLRALYVGFGWAVFFFFISYFYLNKISDQDIRNLISPGKLHSIDCGAKTVRKWWLLSFCAFVTMGSFIELQRGMWPMWVETVLLVGLMSMVIWKIYKHVFRAENA